MRYRREAVDIEELVLKCIFLSCIFLLLYVQSYHCSMTVMSLFTMCENDQPV